MYRKHMITVTVACLVLLLTAVVPAAAGGPNNSALAAEKKGPPGQPGEEVVARVNGVAITAAALNARVERVLRAKGHGAASQEDFRAIVRKALDKLIIQELAYQKARAEGMKVSPEEMDTIISSLKKRAGGEEKYRELLEKNNVTEATVRKELERNRLVKEIFEKDVLSKVVMSNDEIKNEYEKTKSDFIIPEKVVIDDVILFLDPGNRDSLKKAEALRRKIIEDKDKDPTHIPSDGTFMVREVQPNKNRQKELYDAAIKLKPGEVSGIIMTADSLHIIKLKEYSPQREAGFDQVKGYVEARLRAQKAKKIMAVWEEDLKKGAKIEILDAAGKFEERQ